MNRILKLHNTIQPYAWGSLTAIAELLGHPAPSEHPQAELWMGAHAKAPSKVWFQGRWQSMDDLIQADPDAILGPTVVERFGAQLPFLFKVLAVDKPLSIQAHPSKSMAREGFARENTNGIALSAPHRNYRDDQHKPECLCALTPFQALCGFRPCAEITALIDPIWPDDRRDELDLLTNGSHPNHLRPFFVHLMRMDVNQRSDLISRLVNAASQLKDQSTAYQWMVDLYDAYPNDVGVLSPALLHLIELQPGQALFLPAGRLHAYLNGVAIEIMANSDNVLRGGLTPKHVDVDELLQVLDFESYPLQVLEPRATSSQEYVYASNAEEFRLSSLHIAPTETHKVQSRKPSPEILLCIEGAAHIAWTGNSKGLDIGKGESFLIPAACTDYELDGQAVLYKAAVGDILPEGHP